MAGVDPSGRSKASPFEYLSTDKLIEICESLNDHDLAQLVQTSQTAYSLCYEILDKRHQVHKKKLGPWYPIFTELMTVDLPLNQQQYLNYHSRVYNLCQNMKNCKKEYSNYIWNRIQEIPNYERKKVFNYAFQYLFAHAK